MKPNRPQEYFINKRIYSINDIFSKLISEAKKRKFKPEFAKPIREVLKRYQKIEIPAETNLDNFIDDVVFEIKESLKGVLEYIDIDQYSNSYVEFYTGNRKSLKQYKIYIKTGFFKTQNIIFGFLFPEKEGDPQVILVDNLYYLDRDPDISKVVVMRRKYFYKRAQYRREEKERIKNL